MIAGRRGGPGTVHRPPENLTQSSQVWTGFDPRTLAPAELRLGRQSHSGVFYLPISPTSPAAEVPLFRLFFH